MQYWRESSRSGHLRGREHRQDFEHNNQNSHMIRNMIEEHKEIDLEDVANRRAENYCTMEIASQHTTAMDRQLSKALVIAKAGGMDHPSTMNRSTTGAFYQSCITQLKFPR